MMKTTSPTHEEIARRAHEIWHDRGSPNGSDTAIWLEAEQLLSADSPEPQHFGAIASHATHRFSGRNFAAATGGVALVEAGHGEPPAAHLPGHRASAPSPDQIAAQAAFQKKAARAPQQQHGKSAPQPPPPESGKPLWDTPHSS